MADQQPQFASTIPPCARTLAHQRDQRYRRPPYVCSFAVPGLGRNPTVWRLTLPAVSRPTA